MVCMMVMLGCHRTAPQSPSHRSSEAPKADGEVMALMELNRRMVGVADKTLTELADSLHRADGIEFAQMMCGGWKSKRSPEAREKWLYADNPKAGELWTVRLRTQRLDGSLVTDTEGTYKVHKYELPIAVEEAIEDMYSGEQCIVLAPWYCAYGIRGNEYVAGYENVIFEVILGEKN